jgi:hypothetical protein
VPVSNAIAGIDLAGKKQMVVVTDHDSRVFARKTFRCRAWELGSALDWAAARGELMSRAATRDITNAVVARTAADLHADIITGDHADIHHLLQTANATSHIIDI